MAGVKGWDAISRSKPTIRQLQNIVIPKVAAKYYELGIELYKDSDVNHLDTIQRGCAMDFSKGCTDMLKFWRQTYGEAATWDRLINGLKAKGLQLNAIALEIKREVVKDLEQDQQADPTLAIFNEKPSIRDVMRIVIPEVKAYWKDLAFSMEYKIREVKTMERDGQDSGERCSLLFEDWLDTNHGCTPKTWQNLLDRIKDVDELTVAAEHIKQQLSARK